MCCNVGGVSFFFFAGGRKKQNKFPSNLHCPVKKLNPFFRYYLSLSYLSVVCLFTLVANGGPPAAGAGFTCRSLYFLTFFLDL
jgi:hypothetical protein